MPPLFPSPCRLGILLSVLTAFLSASDPPIDPYVPLYARIIAQQETTVLKHGPAERLWMVAAALGLAERTGKKEYQNRAAAWFSSVLPVVADARSDFHSLRGVAMSLAPLQAAGLIHPNDLASLRLIANRTWKEFLAAPAGTPEGDADHNIHLAMALACAGFANFFAHDPLMDTTRIRNRLAAFWEQIAAVGDLDEDANNYSALGIVHAIELAELLGRTDDLRSPNFRRMFERQRDVISPTGRLPEFGDGYFHLERDAFDYLYVCEYAAALYDDPSYLTVARRMFDSDSYANAPPDEWGRGTGLLRLKRLDGAPSPLPTSPVSYRAVRSRSDPVPDKLILRTGTAPGDAMVMLDLYASGSHAHPAKGPSVGYYEVDGVPLFHNLGRHRTRSAIAGNSFWALPSDEAFPGVWKPETWFTMRIPAKFLNHDEAGNISIGQRVVLRTFDNPGTTRLWFDNLRLVGPGKNLLLDDFESPDGWSKSLMKTPRIAIASDPLHTHGTASQSLAWGVLPAGSHDRLLADARDLTCAAGEVTALKLDVRYTGVRPYLHLRDLGAQVDLGDHALPYHISKATTEQHGSDAAGTIVFGQYLTDDARLVRRLILSREGILVIQDRWTAGKGEPSWNAGQLWQFYALAERGGDWFASEDDGPYQVADATGTTTAVRRRMVVKFALPSTARSVCETNVQPYHCPNPRNRRADAFVTIGSVQPVAAGDTAVATMVVVPQSPVIPAANVAAGINVTSGADGTQVTVSSIGPIVRITLTNDAGWEITRPASDTPRDRGR